MMLFENKSVQSTNLTFFQLDDTMMIYQLFMWACLYGVSTELEVKHDGV